MTPFRNNLKTPEEIELEKKRYELACLKEQCSSRESDYVAFKAEIKMFERVYEENLGSRISKLEDLEWQLNGLLGSNSSSEPLQHSTGFSCFNHRTDLLDDDIELSPHTPGRNLKSIYRDVAKAIHPDLAPDDGERQRRQELMATANHAYDIGDRKTLEDILSDWEPESGKESDEGTALELVRAIREIARVQQNIHAFGRQIEELKATDIYQFKIRVDESLADGIDLLAEMVAAIDLDIIRTMNRLAVLRGESARTCNLHGTPLETRVITFLTNVSCGSLYERGRNSHDYRDWKYLGDARGAREVFLDKSLRLDVKGGAGHGFNFLGRLHADDLQALFLYEVNDEALQYVQHLTGLEEIYFSNTKISDTGLNRLEKLKGLKRISIYHSPISDTGIKSLMLLTGLKWLTCSGTSVSEEGLALLRRALPGCKVVNFIWRYNT
jgi:hypothetical protein